MSRHGVGIHMPNGAMNNADFLRLGDGAYTLLHGERGHLTEMRRVAPNALILMRFYLSNWYRTSPDEWARECARLYRSDVAPWTKHVTWANEQNLGHESGGIIGADPRRAATKNDYEFIHTWNMAFLDAWFKEDGTEDAILHYPAFATGHSDDQDDGAGCIGLDVCRPGIERCQVLDRHHYWSVDLPLEDQWRGVKRYERGAALFPTMWKFVKESGNFAVTDPRSPEQYVKAAVYFASQKDCLGSTPFIGADPTNSHKDNDMSRNPAILNALVDMPKVQRDDWLKPLQPTPKPPPEKDETLKTTTIGGLQIFDIRDRFPFVGGRTYPERDTATIRRFVQHHYGWLPSGMPTTIDGALKMLDEAHAYHTGTHKWPAIGYHLAADALGNVYYLNNINLVTYHARSANDSGIGVLWLGTFGETGGPMQPPEAMLAATRTLYRALETHLKRSLSLVGHYEAPTNATSCPGVNHWPTTKASILAVPKPPEPDYSYLGEGIRNWLKANPDAGSPRPGMHYFDAWGNEIVWLTATPRYPSGPMLVARKYYNWEIRVTDWGPKRSAPP